MKHEPLFRGSAVALVTPLRGGKVDVEALHRLVEMHVDNGTAAIVACGPTGEPATLTPTSASWSSARWSPPRAAACRSSAARAATAPRP